VNPDQAALIRKAHESLRAARLLEREGIHDFAVSRAYYTMFYVAEALLIGEGLEFSKHSAVISAFGQHFARTGRVPPEYHRHLLDSHDGRVAGDYGYEKSFAEEQAGQHIAHAEQFLDLAEQMLGPLPSGPGKDG